MRKVAQAASAGNVKQNDFDQFWPLPQIDKTADIPSWAATSIEMRKELLIKLGLKK